MRIAYLAPCLAAAILTFAAPASAQTFTTLHQFCAKLPCDDGAGPLQAPLVEDASGNFFGTAQNFGANNGGTLFQLVGGTTFKKVFDFAHGTDPRGPLVQDASGNLFGIIGTGATGVGGVYELAPGNSKKTKWTYKRTVYSFCPLHNSCPDGSVPIELTYEGAASGVPYDGTSPLYGATVFGGTGSSDAGTVFQLTLSHGQWAQKVLYSFCSEADCTDGMWPAYALFADASGSLYGVATGGGTAGQGVVFKLVPNAKRTKWKRSILYSFCKDAGCTDGGAPSGLVADGQGNLYGTTSSGGDANRGTIFRLTPQGKRYAFTRLYSFCQQADCADGDEPLSAMIVGPAGTLYGTTSGDSRVFSFEPQTSTYTVLHAFCTDAKCGDGFEPEAPLTLDAGGHLFGTTAFGGSKHSGGTIFELAP